MHFTHKEIKIGMPETPFVLRVNKQVGCFAVGNIEAGSIESVETFGRGKSIEFAIAQCDTDLHGKVGRIKEDQSYAFVSAIIVKAEDARLPKGLLVHFLVYGYEARFFTMLAMEAETQAIFGSDRPSQIIKMVFDKSVSTQYGTSIKPPTISVRNASKAELPYIESVDVIYKEYPHCLPDAACLYPPQSDPESGEVVSGLVRLRSSMALTGANELKQIAAVQEVPPLPLSQAELEEMPY